jgi:hypothetical protein
LKETSLNVPLDVYYVPSHDVGRALKEEMHCHLFHIFVAHDTIVTLLKVLMALSKHISSIESIHEEEPSKKFYFGHAF